MAGQLHPTNREFNDLIECTLDRETFIQILRNKGKLDE